MKKFLLEKCLILIKKKMELMQATYLAHFFTKEKALSMKMK